jgi:hypothetical protein
MKRWIAAIFAFGTILTGCVMSGSIFNTEPFVDAKKDEKGNSVLLDTPRMWADFVNLTNKQISSEKKGERPPGVSDWNKHWQMRIHEMENGSRENSSRYINYIIQQRRGAGLPELI